MILVVGSTGLLGSEICRQLTEKGQQVRALVRKTSAPEKISSLKKMGCEIVEGDLKDPGSIRSACQGVESVIATASSTISRQEGDSIQTVDNGGLLRLVEAANQAGVKKFVFISFPQETEFHNSLDEAKRAVEKKLQESDMDYTSLQANFFMEVWLGPALGFDFPNQNVRIFGSGNAKSNWISFIDVASFAVASLDHPKARNSILKLGGPEPLSALEVVRIFEQESGNNFQVEKVPVEALLGQKQQASNPLEDAFACLMLRYSKGWPMEMEDLPEAFGIPLTSVRDYARSALGVQQTAK